MNSADKRSTWKEVAERYRSGMEKMYWIFQTIILLYDRLGTTPIIAGVKSCVENLFSDYSADLVDLVFYFFLNLRYLIIIPAIYTWIIDIKGWRRKTITAAFLALGLFYADYWQKLNDTMIFEIMLLIVASYGKEFKRIAYQGIRITLGVVFTAVVLWCFKVLPDYPQISEEYTRHSFGMFFYTDLAAHLLFIVALYIFVKNGALNKREYIVAIVLILLNIIIIRSVPSVLCALLLVFGCAVRDNVKNVTQGKLCLACKWLFVGAFVFCAAIYMVLNFSYTDDAAALYNSCGLLRGLGERLRISANVTRVLPFSWFGKYFFQIGIRGDAMSSSVSFLTFLDCSYIRIYVMYGVVAFIFVLVLFSGIQYRLLKSKMVFKMFVLAVVALHAIAEHRLMDPAYNLFLLLPYTVLREDSLNVTKE